MKSVIDTDQIALEEPHNQNSQNNNQETVEKIVQPLENDIIVETKSKSNNETESKSIKSNLSRYNAYGVALGYTSTSNIPTEKQNVQLSRLPEYIYYLNMVRIGTNDAIITISNLPTENTDLSVLESECHDNINEAAKFKPNPNKVKILPSRLLGKTWILILSYENLLFTGMLISTRRWEKSSSKISHIISKEC